jgi:hypothetical protein
MTGLPIGLIEGFMAFEAEYLERNSGDRCNGGYG